MKKQFLMLIASAALVLTSCSSELTKEELNDIYIEKAQKYLDVQIEQDHKDGKDEDLLKIEIVKIDSITDLTKQNLSMITYNRHASLFDLEYDLWEKYKDIDPDYTLESTSQQFEKVKLMNEELQAYLSKIEKMDNKKALAKSVHFSVKLSFKDGSTEKTNFTLYFNKENEIEKKYMDYIFGEIKEME